MLKVRLITVKLGKKIKELRIAQGLTQQQLADRLGVSKSVVSYYESGVRYPSYEVLVRIAYVFHTTTDYLLGISRENTIDVTGLTKEEINLVKAVAESLRKKRP